MTIIVRSILILCFALLGAKAALADTLPSSERLHQALADGVIVSGYELDSDGLNSFYAARDYRPAWNLAGVENGAALNGFVDSIDRTIAYHGLTRGDFGLDAMRQLAAAGDDDSRLRLELLVTDTLLRLAHYLHGDNIDLDDLYPGWNFHRAALDIPAVMQKAVAADSVNQLFEQIAPKTESYAALARALRQYQAFIAKGGWAPIDAGPVLRPNDHGRRVVQLRARLAAEDYTAVAVAGAEDRFDDGLAKALMNYQMHNGLDADGHVGAETLMALNVPLTVRVDQIRANMERWRHMPDGFPLPRAVIVNIADATVEIQEGARAVYRGPVVVGQVERKTPFIQSVIGSMIINPSWHVPAKIARADILPKLREDPLYLQKLGIVIKDSGDDPHGARIDWKNLPDEEFNFRLRQQPGVMNSLGRLKFDFPNTFAVYLHGTPHQELFSKSRRTLSSGCVRLRDPQMVAEILLGGTPGDWDVAHIEAAIAARRSRWIALARPMPIAIVYWSVFEDETGRLQFRPDVYDYDRFLIENITDVGETPDPQTESESPPG